MVRAAARVFTDRPRAGKAGMAEAWWKEGQAYVYVAAHFPCESPLDARLMIERMLEEGTLSARYRRPDGTIVAIKRQEWLRRPPPHIEATDWVGELDWSGYNQEVEREHALGTCGSIEVEALTLERLCASQRAEEIAPKSSGKPPREIVARLLVLAGMRIEELGVPAAGSGGQAELERFLTGQAGGQIKSESRIREIAVQAIGIAAAYRKAGS